MKEAKMATTKIPEIQKIDFTKHVEARRDDFIAWMFFSAVGNRDGEGGMATMKEMGLPRKDLVLDVQFAVNGVDLPFEETMLQLHAQFDRMVADKAEEIVKEKFSEAFDKLDSSVKTFRDQLGVKDDEY